MSSETLAEIVEPVEEPVVEPVVAEEEPVAEPVVEPVVEEEEEDADEDDIAEHLRNCGRGDLQIYVDEFTGSIEKCVKLLLEKYPVKRISKKQYKPADDIA